jgi:hypothetical protein
LLAYENHHESLLAEAGQKDHNQQSQAMDSNNFSQLCSKHSLGTVVVRAENGLPDWIVDNGILRNSRADYFSLGLYATERGDPVLLMKQNETALVMLLLCNIDGHDSVLLSLRLEPGLIGLTNFSTTIQSTPSNYLRKHGGKSTPFIEIAMDPNTHGKILYDGMQYDWGDYYLNKTKRLLIVELESPIEAPKGYCWVTLETAKALLREDHLITNDLRVAIPLIPSRGDQPSGKTAGTPSCSDIREPLRTLQFSPSVIDYRGMGVAFFKTETETREVNRWVQPLLVSQKALKISLAFANNSSGRIYAIEKRTQPGLLEHQLWFPSNICNGKSVRTVKTSAEGGRFWKYPIEIELIEIETHRDATDHEQGGQSWLSQQSLSLLVTQSLQTSLELRMAWSLVSAGGIDTP